MDLEIGVLNPGRCILVENGFAPATTVGEQTIHLTTSFLGFDLVGHGLLSALKYTTTVQCKCLHLYLCQFSNCIMLIPKPRRTTTHDIMNQHVRRNERTSCVG